MGLNVQTIGRPGGLLQLRSNDEFSYYVFSWERKTGLPGSQTFLPKLAAGENDPSAGDALIVLSDLFTPVLFAVTEYDCRFWASGSSAPGTLELDVRYSDGGSLITSEIDSQGWVNGCNSSDGARISGGSKNIFSAIRNDGSKWGEIAISAARGGSGISECSGNFATATVLMRVDTPKVLSVENFESANYSISVDKL